jgi:hypothetical protein
MDQMMKHLLASPKAMRAEMKALASAGPKMKAMMNADQEKMETSHDEVTIKVGQKKDEGCDNSYPVRPE